MPEEVIAHRFEHVIQLWGRVSPLRDCIAEPKEALRGHYLRGGANGCCKLTFAIPRGLTWTSVQNPRNAESFSSLSRISKRAWHLRGSAHVKSWPSTTLYRIPLLSENFKLRSNNRWLNETYTSERYRGVFVQTPGRLCMQKARDQPMNEAGHPLSKLGVWKASRR